MHLLLTVQNHNANCTEALANVSPRCNHVLKSMGKKQTGGFMLFLRFTFTFHDDFPNSVNIINWSLDQRAQRYVLIV